MPEHISSVAKVGVSAWLFSLDGTPPFTCFKPGATRVVESDSFIDDDDGNSADEPPAWEIFSADDTIDSQYLTNPPVVLLQWRSNSSVAAWRVERLSVEGVWELEATITETGLGYLQYSSGEVSDQDTVQYRVVGRDLQGNDAPAAGFSTFVVRNPQPPSIQIDYVAGNAVVSVRQ